MYRIASLFLLQSLKGSMSGDARDFSNMETRALIKFFFPAWQGAEGNSSYSDRNMFHPNIKYHQHEPEAGEHRL